MEKECTTCHETKPLDAYNKSAQGKYGHASRCRQCTKAEQARYRAENPEKMREARKSWVQNNPEKHREHNKRWAEKNADKVRATVDRIQKQYKEETSKTAVNNGKPWTDEDYETLMRDDLTIVEISKLLGRTWASTQVKRNIYAERLKRLAMIEEVQKRIAG
jgi:hypothetical protein